MRSPSISYAAESDVHINVASHTHVSTWVFGIASNLALNELARAHRRREHPWEEPIAARVEDPEPRADEALLAKRTAAQLEEGLRRLPDRQRAALLLRVEEDLGYGEISEALGLPLGTVKARIHRARALLKKRLEQETS